MRPDSLGRRLPPARAKPTRSPSNPTPTCAGPLARREFLRVGLSGFASLSLPGLFQLRARASAATGAKPRTAVILVWLRGGLSHLETYDCKPDAPAEVRGTY